MNAACAIALDQESCQFRLYGTIFVLVECNETYLPGLRIFAEQLFVGLRSKNRSSCNVSPAPAA